MYSDQNRAYHIVSAKRLLVGVVVIVICGICG